MKRICTLLLLSLICSTELTAQEDHPENSGTDSLAVISTPLRLDTAYYPPCILPLEYEAKAPVLAYNLVYFDSGCHAKGARKDLKNGKAIIWFPGGAFGCDFSSKSDQEFQNRYQVKFVSPGCCRLGDEDPEAYNAVIFDYMDKKYGTGWRDELRADAKGFKPPKTSRVAAAHISLNTSPLSMELANLTGSEQTTDYSNPETPASIWWYILPTSGFALLLGLYFIKRRK